MQIPSVQAPGHMPFSQGGWPRSQRSPVSLGMQTETNSPGSGVSGEAGHSEVGPLTAKERQLSIPGHWKASRHSWVQVRCPISLLSMQKLLSQSLPQRQGSP